MCWTSFETVGHSSKTLGPSKKTPRPSWCPKLVTGLHVSKIWIFLLFSMFFIQRACTCVSYQREVYVLLFDQKRRMGDTRTARAFGDFETYVLSRRDCYAGVAEKLLQLCVITYCFCQIVYSDNVVTELALGTTNNRSVINNVIDNMNVSASTLNNACCHTQAH